MPSTAATSCLLMPGGGPTTTAAAAAAPEEEASTSMGWAPPPRLPAAAVAWAAASGLDGPLVVAVWYSMRRRANCSSSWRSASAVGLAGASPSPEAWRCRKGYAAANCCSLP